MRLTRNAAVLAAGIAVAVLGWAPAARADSAAPVASAAPAATEPAPAPVAAAAAMPAKDGTIPETSWGLPHDASSEGFGSRIDWLINVTTIFVSLLFVIMCVWMGWSVMQHGEKHSADYDHGDSKKSVRTALMISAVIFFVVDGNLWVNATIDVNGQFWNFAYADTHPEGVKVEVNAHAWAWDFRYPGPDGAINTKDDIISLNDLRVPVGVPVLLELASVDVIHSFYLPNFRTKSDAVPGMVNRMWFTSKEIGHYEIACAQHCGPNHYKMKGILTVLSKEDYAKWAAEASANSARVFNPADTAAHWGWAWGK